MLSVITPGAWLGPQHPTELETIKLSEPYEGYIRECVSGYQIKNQWLILQHSAMLATEYRRPAPLAQNLQLDARRTLQGCKESPERSPDRRERIDALL